MAKRSGDNGGSTRLRLVIVEADGFESADIGQLAQAVQNALRPQPIIQQRIMSPAQPGRALPTPSTPPQQAEMEFAQDEGSEVETSEPIRKPKEPRVRRTIVPKAVEMDPEAVSSWKEYATGKDPDSDLGRALVVAAWHSEHRAGEPVTPGHVYACYRFMKWPVGLTDFGSPLRKLKQQQRLNSAGRGSYTITQIGLQDVEEMGVAG